MKSIINPKIKDLISYSIKSLKSNLSSSKEIPIVVNEFYNIYHSKISTSEAYLNLRKDKIISNEKLFIIETPFYNIGNHIAIPARTGATNLLREAYKEDVKDSLEVNFLSYQVEVIRYVHDQVQALETSLDVDDSKEQSSGVANGIEQLKNGEFAKTFDPDEYKKLSGIITKLGGKQINSVTDYIDNHLFDYELGNDRVTIFINEPWDMTFSSHNPKLIEEITNLMGDSGNAE